MALLHMLTAAALTTALAIAGGTVGSGRLDGPTPAERAFPDAPYGVDAMVTGPVSASFRQRQAQAGCDRAVWPDVPIACYPQ